MLSVTDLNVNYGHVRAVSGASFHVDAGEVVALLGGNGAGKTTTLNTISGLIRAASGEIVANGQRIERAKPKEIVRLGIIQVPEGRKIFPELTVEENLEMGAYSRADDFRPDLERVYAMFPRLAERRRQAGGTLSGGEQQMLAIGRALMARPRLLMLDEPSLGLAPIVVEQLFETIRQISQQQVTVLLVEQNARMALDISGRAYILQQGHIVAEGPARTLLETDFVRRAYLGVAADPNEQETDQWRGR